MRVIDFIELKVLPENFRFLAFFGLETKHLCSFYIFKPDFWLGFSRNEWKRLK